MHAKGRWRGCLVLWLQEFPAAGRIRAAAAARDVAVEHPDCPFAEGDRWLLCPLFRARP